MTSATDPVFATFPLPRTSPYLPPAEYIRLLEDGTVRPVTMRDGSRAWAVSRHEDVRAAFAHPHLSSDRRHPKWPGLAHLLPEQRNTPYLLGMDPPDHAAARKAVVGEFTLRRLEALRPRVQQIVDDRVDVMLDGPRPTDLVRDLALPVPSLVICEQLGVPYADHDFFQQRSSTMLQMHSTTPEERGAAAADLRRYLSDLLVEKRADPTDDLLGRQIRRQLDEAGEVDHGALVELAFILLLAGHETTANMISLGVLAFLEQPHLLDAVRNDPGITPNAVEELLRVFTIADAVTARVAVADVEIGGVTIPAGDPVLVLGNAANHDGRAFADPDRLDTDRGARNHVAFGFGIHQCLGQNLARIELQVTFDTLFARIPELRLARDTEDLPFKDDGLVYGLYELPVTW